MSDEPLQNKSGTPPMAGLLEGLLSNPEMIKRIGGILGAMTSAAPSEDVSSDAKPIPDSSVSEPMGDTSAPPATPTFAADGLASLLSDPSMLEKLPQILSVMKPLLASMPPPKLASAPQQKPLSAQDCRDNLLLALKPFLSNDRRDAVDTIIRISRLGTVFKQLQ